MNNLNTKRKRGRNSETSRVYKGIRVNGYHEIWIEYPAYTPPEHNDDAMYGDYLLNLPRISEQIDDNKPKVVIEQPKSHKKSDKCGKHVRFDMEDQIQEELTRKLNLYKERNKLLEEGLRKMVMRKRLLEQLFNKVKRNPDDDV